MKKVFTFFAAVLLTASVFAQSPEKMSYQAVIRDNGGNLVTKQEIGMQISILHGSASGTAVYVETQTPTTNTNGLASIEIGAGTVQSGDFATIDWANGPYFIKTETDPSGHTNYTITGTHQLLSVPYALYAKESGSSIKEQTVYTITLPIAGTLTGSINNAVEGTDFPTGWNLSASGTNLEIGHNTDRYVANVSVFYNTGGEGYRQLVDFQSAYNNILNYNKDSLSVIAISEYYTQYQLKVYLLLQ